MTREVELSPSTLAIVDGRLDQIEGDFRRRYSDLLGEAVESAYELGTAAVDGPLAAVGIAGVVSIPTRQTLEVLRAFAVDLVPDLSADIRRRVRRSLVLGATGILDLTSVQREIQRVMPSRKVRATVKGREITRLIGPEARAEMITRTEISRVHSMAQQARRGEIAQAMGVRLRKRWITFLDERVREHHRIHGQTVSFDENFQIPAPRDRKGARAESAQAPRDPRLSAYNSVRCRCDAVTLPPEGMSWDEVGSERFASVL
jgi:hypothetical protein